MTENKLLDTLAFFGRKCYNVFMKVFAIGDLHLSGNNPKPMDIFGASWANYLEEIEADWRDRAGEDDVVLIAGDISWAMNLADAKTDLDYISSLPAKKVMIRGNHDYWWKSIGAVRSSLGSGTYAVQNDCLRIGELLVCGSRGWTTPESSGGASAEDKKIYAREIQRVTLSLEAMKKMRKENDRVVTMIHFPPFNSRFEASPFTRLFEEYGVDFVVYGHLHGNPGRMCFRREINGVNYFLTSCDLVRNKLVYITEIQT